MAHSDILLTFNAGSSTVKIGIFRKEGDIARLLARAHIDFRQAPLCLELKSGESAISETLRCGPNDDLHRIVDETLDHISKHFEASAIAAVGHRIVHGGTQFTEPVRLTKPIISAIEDLAPLAPLHQLQALRFVEALRILKPGIMQTASFDTAFHSTQPDIVRRFAIPRALHDDGIKRYGFHGLSYKFIALQLAKRAPDFHRAIVAHLGSGASLCALKDLASVDCSMGFSTLDGVPMATRPGSLDSGVLLYLLGQKNLSLVQLEDILYHRSGLAGVSSISSDTRTLLSTDSRAAREAIELFCFRIAGEISRMCTTLSGLDALVFTAGIGEHQPAIRERVCGHLQWLGLQIDPGANASNAIEITSPASHVRVLVIPTDEEQIIADETLSVVNGRQQPAVTLEEIQ